MATLLLDSVSADAAWSFIRKVRSAYSGDAFRLREDGGDTETDIGFDSNGQVDQAAILSHCGSNSGYVVKVYDQSGNGRDLSAATSSEEPRIVNAGTIETYRGKPRAVFITNTGLRRSDSCGLSGNPGWTYGILAECGSGTRIFNFLGTDSAGTGLALWGDTSHRYLNGNEIFSDAMSTTGDIQHLLSTQPAGGQYDSGQLWIDGTESTSSSSTNPTNTHNLADTNTIMGAADASWWVQNSWQEWILFSGALSSGNRSALIAEQIEARDAIVPSPIASTSTVYQPSISTSGGGQTVTPGAIASGSAANAPQVDVGAVSVTPGAISSTSSASAPTAAPGPVTASPGAIASTSTLYAPTASVGAVTLDPAAIASTLALFAPTATPGGVAVTPGAIGSTATLLALTVGAGGLTVAPAQISSTATLLALTASPGPVTLTPGQVASTALVYAPQGMLAGAFVLPGLVGPGSQLYSPTAVPAGVQVTPGAIASTLAILAPQVAVGAQAIDAPAIAAASALLAPQVSAGGATLVPALIASTGALYAPQAVPGGVVVQPGAIAAAGAIYAPGVVQLMQLGHVGSTAQVYAIAGLTLGAATILPGVISGTVLYAPAIQGGQAPTGDIVLALDPRTTVLIDPRNPVIYVRPPK